MPRKFDVVIYGSYGYTGTLITKRCREQGLNALLSGRNKVRLAGQSSSTGFPYEACELQDQARLQAMLRKAHIVLHCAGPFQYTAKEMIEACLAARTHYLDITGEYTVFEMLASYHHRAKDSGILVMPGVGFDVVPSDCLALYLKNRLPTATHLQLAFAVSGGGMSRGTIRTVIEGLGKGSVVRRNGELVATDLGELTLDINFGNLTRTTMCIPWGDIATAWRSTMIPNIEVYSAIPPMIIRVLKLSPGLNWLLRKRLVKQCLLTLANRRPAGPEEHQLNSGKAHLWGRVSNASGQVIEARLSTVNGYRLTAEASVLVAAKLLNGSVQAGYFTPAQYFGEDLILEVDESYRF